MKVELQINNSASPDARFVGWAPAPCRIRVTNPIGAISPSVKNSFWARPGGGLFCFCWGGGGLTLNFFFFFLIICGSFFFFFFVCLGGRGFVGGVEIFVVPPHLPQITFSPSLFVEVGECFTGWF